MAITSFADPVFFVPSHDKSRVHNVEDEDDNYISSDFSFIFLKKLSNNKK